MAWRIRLVVRPGDTVMDIFSGSGSTGIAAYREGAKAILIERDAEYFADINMRLAFVAGRRSHSAHVKTRHKEQLAKELLLFGASKDGAE